MTFKPTFADWRSLFIDIVPAHIARTVGWNTGFSGPPQTISGSWFKIQSYDANQSLVLTRNPTYWGTPAKLNKLVFQFFSDDSQLVPALQNNEINIFNPSTREPVDRPDGQPGAEHHQGDDARARVRALRLQSGGPLPGQGRGPRGHRPRRKPADHHHPDRRSDRAGITPLGSRMLVPASRATRATATPTDPSQSIQLAQEVGFKKASDGYFQPTTVPRRAMT